MTASIDLSPELRANLLETLRSYLEAPPLQDGRTPVEIEAELDRARFATISRLLKPLLEQYFAGAIQVSEFKRRIDGINKRNPHWGFSGIKGQMFFNMILKTAEDFAELDSQLKAAIREPASEQAAADSLKTFGKYVIRIGQKFVDGGGDAHSKPKPGSVPFFVSYFWQIQRPEVWPVFYTNSVQMIESMNLWQEAGEIDVDYLSYKHLHEALSKLFSATAKRQFTLYDVEHVFWFKSGKLIGAIPELSPDRGGVVVVPTDAMPDRKGGGESSTGTPLMLPDAYVPPIVEIIPKLAANDMAYQEVAKRSGTTLERAFEKSVHAAFTVLGYETRLLGQGKGRVPDGQAIAVDDAYAILWDSKARADGYKMGTDDRVIRQYIDDQCRGLKRTRRIKNIYYVIVSSGFMDDFDDLIRALKMETEINEVCLVEGAALVSIVDQKLRAPLGIGLGPDGIQRLFSASGVVTSARVSETLG